MVAHAAVQQHLHRCSLSWYSCGACQHNTLLFTLQSWELHLDAAGFTGCLQDS